MGKYRTTKQTQQCFPSPDKKQCYKNPPSCGGNCRSNSTNPINHNPSSGPTYGYGQVWNFWPILTIFFAGSFFIYAEAAPVFTEVQLDNRDAGTVEPNSSPFDYYSATSLLFPESFKTNLNVYSYESGVQNGSRSGSEIFEFQNCTPPGMDNYPPDLFTKEQRRSGAIAIHFIVSAYLFYALLFICDDYFVPSIECICTELKIPSDIAGATFMAISTSAPELFTNIFGTFVTKGDTGVGTIVGSAVFNILAVGACCGIGTLISGSAKITSRNGKIGIPLDWWSLTRDCAFYSLSVLLLLGVLANRRVYWYEALSLLVLYGIYMIVMCNNASFKKGTERLINCFTSCFSCCWASSDDEDNLKDSLRRLSLTLPKPKSGHLERIHEKTPLLIIEDEKNNYNYRTSIEDSSESSSSSNTSASSTSSSSTSSSNEHLPGVSSEILDELLVSKAIVRSQSYSVIEEEEYGLCHFPRDSGFKSCLAWILGWPIRLVFTLTIPDCRDPKVRKFYPITLILCICWIGGLTYVVSWMMSIIGETLHIPDSVTGLTFLAAGTSIPEVLSSVIVARQGLGSMGLSNSIGSNTFDLLFCLGLPWLIENLILIWSTGTPSGVTYIEIHSGGLEYSIILLITSLLVFYLIIAANGFYLDIKVGISSLVMYGIFITLAIMLELNVFFDVNLPQCD